MQTSELQNQIEMASKIVARNPGLVAIVTETRLSKNARRTSWGFRFRVNEVAEVGMELSNDDGSFSVVRAVVA